MRIVISDPFSSRPISNSPITSAGAGDDDTSPSTGGHPPAWANDSTSASLPLTLSGASSTASQSTLTSSAVIVPVQGSSTDPAQVSSTTPAQVSSTDPAQVSSTNSVSVPTGFTSTASTLSHNHRKRAIAGGIVGGISLLLLLGLIMWFFRRCARKRAARARRGRGGDPDANIEKPEGVLGTKDASSIASANSSQGNANPQESPIAIPPPNSDVPVMAQTDIATPIPPTTSDSTADSPLPNSNVSVMAPTEIATPDPPTTSDSTTDSPLPNSNAPVMAPTEIAPPVPPTASDPTASWKYYIPALPEMPLVSSKIVFAVDASDSTAGPVMQRQREFVLAMIEDYQLPHSVIMWGSSVEQPKSAAQISWDRHRDWGTTPEVIFGDAATTEELKSCNMWYLLTDGEVDSPVNFARKALDVGMANTPVVFVITGTKLTSTTDISVGLPVFASAPDAAIVFKNAASGEIYVVAAKGAFEVLTAGYNINLANLNRKSLPFFPTESALKNALEGISIVDTARLKTGGAVYLGRAWHEKHQCFVRIDRLLDQMPPQSIPENELLDLLEDETFKALALSCKTRGLVQNLRDWLSAKNEQPPNLRNSPRLSRISLCLEKLTALENTGFNVDILEWSSHRSMSAAEAVSSPEVDQEPEVLKAHSSTSATRPDVLNVHSSTSATSAQYANNRRATRTSTVVESSTSLTQHSSYATTYTSNARW